MLEFQSVVKVEAAVELVLSLGGSLILSAVLRKNYCDSRYGYTACGRETQTNRSSSKATRSHAVPLIHTAASKSDIAQNRAEHLDKASLKTFCVRKVAKVAGMPAINRSIFFKGGQLLIY